MMWRAPDDWRRVRQHWTNRISLNPQGLAEQLIEQAFGAFIPLLVADNDRDHLPW